MLNRNTTLLVLLLVAFLLISILIYNQINLKDFFLNNLEAELFGIIIEILIIIFVFNSWEAKKEKEKNIIYEKRLREYLLFFLKFGFRNFPKDIKITNFFGENHFNNIKEIDEFIKFIENDEVEDYQFHSMKNHLMIDKSAFENLLEVASLLSDNHFKSWIRIVYFINKLSVVNDEEIDEIKKIIINILNNIKKFDKASNDCKIYVGAEYESKSFIKEWCFNNPNLVNSLIMILLIVYTCGVSLIFNNAEKNVSLEVDESSITSVQQLVNENNVITAINSLNYSFIIVITLFLFFMWMYYQLYKNNQLTFEKMIKSFFLSFLLTISGTITFKILSINIDKIGFDGSITFYKQINNCNTKNENNNKYLKKIINPVDIYFKKGSIIYNDEYNKLYFYNKNIENIKNIFLPENKYLIKLTGYSSMEKVINKNAVDNNYDISLARANNIKNFLLDIIDEKQIDRKNVIIDIFAVSNQNLNSKYHCLNRKVQIEIIELKPISEFDK